MQCGDLNETGRSLTTRVKEHNAACRLAAFDKSAVAEHAQQTGYKIVWNTNVEILGMATELQERKVRESVYIRLAPKGCRMNRDEGRELSPQWIRTIRNTLKKDTIYKTREQLPR